MLDALNVVTLGVTDLDASRRFYEALGLRPTSSSGEGISFYKLGPSLLLALYPWAALAEDATVAAEGSGFRGVSLAHNVTSRERVDEVLRAAEAAGGTIVKPAQEVFWGGYSGYFADPDRHLWEVAHNPHWVSDGRVEIPD